MAWGSFVRLARRVRGVSPRPQADPDGRRTRRRALQAPDPARGANVSGTPRACTRQPMTPISDRVHAFRRLHEAGCFVLPNPWDCGSARLLAGLGFSALATTSSGFAWSLGRPDNHVSLDETLAHLRSIAGAVTVPVNADFEGGFATFPADVLRNVAAATATGIAGALDRGFDRSASSPLSTSHSPSSGSRPHDERSMTAERILLTGRSEGFIVGRPTSRRRSAASSPTRGRGRLPLCAGIRTESDIAAVVRRSLRTGQCVCRKRFHHRRGAGTSGRATDSVGGALARSAWTGFAGAKEIGEQGTFLGSPVPFLRRHRWVLPVASEDPVSAGSTRNPAIKGRASRHAPSSRRTRRCAVRASRASSRFERGAGSRSGCASRDR